MIAPVAGSLSASSTLVTVHGRDYVPGSSPHAKTACAFGGYAVPSNVTDSSTMRCIAPPSVLGAGFVHVAVSMNGEDFTRAKADDSIFYLYRDPARLHGVQPSGGSAVGGAFIIATSRRGIGGGGGFTPDATCVFFQAGGGGADASDGEERAVVVRDGAQLADASSAPSRWISSAVMRCEMPALPPGVHEVNVGTIPGGVGGVGAKPFASWSVPSEARIAPTGGGALNATATTGATSGGAVVQITWAADAGSYFERGWGASVTCRFGTIDVTANVAGGASGVATASCASPAGGGASGTSVPLWVASSASERAAAATLTHVYEDAMLVEEDEDVENSVPGVVSSVSPRHVRASGSFAPVAVLGAHFSPRANGCVVDGSTSRSHFVSSALVMCELPPHAHGVEAVTVDGGAAVSVATEFAAAETEAELLSATVMFTREATLSRMDVTRGSASGGDVVTASGTALSDGDIFSVRVGTIGSISTRWISKTKVEMITPARYPGTSPVMLYLSGAYHSSSGLEFTHIKGAHVGATMPSIGVASTKVTAFGWGLHNLGYRLACLFDGVQTTDCALPPSASGFLAVGVAGASTLPGNAIAYLDTPRVTSASPKNGFDEGGAIAVVRGENFIDARPACFFDDAASPAAFVSTALLMCETLPGAPGLVRFEAGVITGGIRSASDIVVNYLPTMRVTSVSPRSGPIMGGYVVTIYGTGFAHIEPTACKLGSIGPLTARDNDATGLNLTIGVECVTPARDSGSVLASVGLRTSGYASNDRVRYAYESALAVRSALPTSGESSTARVISLFGASIPLDGTFDCVVGSRAFAATVPRAGEASCAVSGGDATGFVAVGFGGLKLDDGSIDVVFEFRTPAQTLGVYPRSGYAGGGSMATIVTRHASTHTGCALDGVGGAAEFVSSVLIRCETPASEHGGASDAGLRLTDGEHATSAAELIYEYRAIESVTSIDVDAASSPPRSGGGAMLNVATTGHLNARWLACAIGTIAPIRAKFVTARVVACTAPALAPSSDVVVRVGVGTEFGNAGGETTIALASLGDGVDVSDSVASAPVAVSSSSSVSPSVGASTGGSLVEVHGANLLVSPFVNVGDAIVGAHAVSTAVAFVELPPHANGLTTIYDDVAFTYVPRVVLESFTPTSVDWEGGDVVTLRGSFGSHGRVTCAFGTVKPITARVVDVDAVECVTPSRDAGLVDVGIAASGGFYERSSDVIEYVDDSAAPSGIDAAEDDAAPRVVALAPSTAFKNGGSRVLVHGSDLGRFIVLGGVSVPVASFVSSAVVVFEAPYGVSVGPIDVNDAVSGASFAYTAAMSVASFAPSVLSDDGGVVVVVRGNLGVSRRDAACRFGAVGPIAPSFANGAEFHCVAPAKAPDSTTLFVGVVDGAWWEPARSANVTYARAPVVFGDSTVPASVATSGVIPVDVYGLWLSGSSCGSNVASSSTATRCGAGSFSSGFGANAFAAINVVDVAGVPAASFATAAALVEVVLPPRVFSVSPDGGGGDGGVVVFVTGADLVDGGARCAFGAGADAAHAASHLVSSAVARCESPGIVNGFGTRDLALSVTIPGVSATSSESASVAWTTSPTPWIRSSSPSRGGVGGGTVVRLVAGGVVESVQSRAVGGKLPNRASASSSSASACSVGSIGPIATRTSETGTSSSLECLTPAHAPGAAAPVRVHARACVAAPRSARASVDPTFAFRSSGVVIDADWSGDAATAADATARLIGWGLLPSEGEGEDAKCVVGAETRAASFASAGVFACAVPPGVGGFVAVALSHADHVRGDALVVSRQPVATTRAVMPASVSSAAGGVVRILGDDLHAAARVMFDARSVAAIAVSSTMLLLEAPGRLDARELSSTVAITLTSMGAVSGTSNASDATAAPTATLALALAAPRVATKITPTRGVSGGGVRATLVVSPPITGEGAAAQAIACWFGSSGPIAARLTSGGGVECVTPGKGAGDVDVAAAAHPGLVATSVHRAERSGVSFSVHAESEASVAAVLLRATALAAYGGDAEVWTPFTADPASSSVLFGADPTRAKLSGDGEGVRTLSVPARPEGGFVPISLDVDGVNGGETPFAQIEIAAAPVAGTLSPATTPSAGGGVLFLSGKNLRRAASHVVAAAFSSSQGAGAGVSAYGADIRAVSSAVASLEAPSMPPGAASLSLTVHVASSSSSAAAVATAGGATLSIGVLPGADISSMSPSTGPSSPGASGGAHTIVITGRGFLDTGSASCRVGSVGPLRAVVSSAGELSCDVPALTPRGYPVEVSFNRRDYTRAATLPETIPEIVDVNAPNATADEWSYFRGLVESAKRGEFDEAMIIAQNIYGFHVEASRDAAVDVVDKTIYWTAIAPPTAVTAVMPSAVSAAAVGGASVTIIGAGFARDGVAAPCGGGVVTVDTRAELAIVSVAGGVRAPSPAPASNVSRFGYVACPSGSLSTGAITPQGFVAIAAPAAAASEQALSRAVVGEALGVVVFSPPRVDAIDPPIGAHGGGSVVYVTGRNLRRGAAGGGDVDDAWVLFGDVAVEARAVSSAVARVEAPKATAAVAALAIAGGTATEAAAAAASSSTGIATPTFSSAPALAVREVSPARGPTHGGSMITVVGAAASGAGFSVSCKIGTIGPIAAQHLSNATTAVRCLTPATSRGVVNVQLSGNGKDWTVNPPTNATRSVIDASAVVPAGSPPAYVTTTITTHVPVNEFEFTATAIVSAAMPPASYPGMTGLHGGDGGVDVLFATPYASAATAASLDACAFGGSSARGKTIGVTGVNGTICAPVADPFMQGFYPIVIDSPGGGVTGLYVGDGGRDAPFAGVGFEFARPPTATGWSPELTHVGGGAVITIVGADFRVDDAPGGGFLCVFATGPRVGNSVSGYAPASSAAAVTSSALAACEAPGSVPEGVHALSVGLAGSTPALGATSATASSAPVSVTAAPVLTDIAPSSGVVTGGVVVSLSGRNLKPRSGSDDVAARIGTFGPIALRSGAGSGHAETIAPAHVHRVVDVAIGRAMSDYSHVASERWTYHQPFVSRDASPPVVAAAGGATVTLFADLGFLPTDLELASGEDALASPADARATRPVLRRGGVNGTRSNEASLTSLPNPGAGFSVPQPPSPWAHRGVNTAGSEPHALIGSWPQLEHRPTAVVRAVFPRICEPNGGGSVLDLVGGGFVLGETAARFGEFAAPGPNAAGVVISSALMRLEATGDHNYDTQAPAEVASSHAAVRDPNAWSADGVLIAFHRTPRALQSEPAWGTEEGGTAAKLTGSDVRDTGAQLKCSFGSTVVVSSGFMSVNHLECVSPAHAPSRDGYLPRLGVAVNGRDFSPEISHAFGPLTFTYGARIEVYGLQPNYGPSVGGTSVIVHGKNFVPAVDLNAKPTFTCRFGFFPVLASNALGEEVTATTATCRSPPHAVGFVSVEVSAGPGNFTTFGVVFEFQAAHEPEVLFPPTGLASGGTLVTVAGANFIASNQQWGYGHGNTAQPGSGGGIFLGSGSDAMKGKDALSCRFGGVGAYTVGASAVSSAVLRCETPTFSDAAVGRSLSVDTSTNAGEDFTGSQTYFEPLAEALVLSLSPPAGTSGGGTVVNVFGAGFTVDEPVWCKFGTTGPIPAEYHAENIVRCKSPAKATNMAVPLEVSRGNTFDLTRNNVIFSI